MPRRRLRPGPGGAVEVGLGEPVTTEFQVEAAA